MTATEIVGERLISVRGVAELLDCSRPHVYKLFKAGRIPQPIRLASGTLRWKRSDLVEFFNGLRSEPAGVP